MSRTPGAILVRPGPAWGLLLLLAGCREHIPEPKVDPSVQPKMDAAVRDMRGGSGGAGTGASAGGAGGGAGLPDMGAAGTGGGAGMDMGAEAAPDQRADTSDASDAMPDGMVGGCGAARPALTGITNADGVAVASDGTLYFTQVATPDGFVGRLRPDGSPVEKQWLRVPMGARLWGLAVDGGRRRLYMASASGKAIHWVDLAAATPAIQNLVTGLNNPNDIAIAKNGDIYFSDQGDRHIHRVTPAGMRSMVTRTPIGPPYAPAGLAFGPDGQLYVGTSTGGGPIFRLQLTNGVETGRQSYGHYIGWGNGLAFDERGRLYLSTYAPGMVEARVVRIASDTSGAIQLVSGMRFGGMAFGRGALSCRDVYIASSAGALLRFEADVPGLPLP